MPDPQLAELARTVDTLQSRESIRDALYRYARGIDRRDADEVRNVFWADSKVNFGIYKGSGHEFASLIGGWFTDGGVEITAHLIGNIVIRLDGDTAHTESYLHAAHRLAPSGGSKIDCFVGARYQDRFERRDRVWKIAERVLIYDWFREYPDSGDFKAGSAMGFNADNSLIGAGGHDAQGIFPGIGARAS